MSILLALSCLLIVGCPKRDSSSESKASKTPVTSGNIVNPPDAKTYENRTIPFSAINEKITLGRGFQTLSATPASTDVVVNSGDSPNTGNAHGAKITYDVTISTSTFDIFHNLTASASLAFNSLLAKGNAYYKLAQTTQSSRNSLYLAITCNVVNSPTGLDHFDLTSTAVADALRLTPAKFYELYGDSFIAGTTTGGQFIALLEIHNESLQERNETEAGLSAAVGHWTAEAQFSDVVNKNTAGKQLKAHLLKDGGIRDIPEPTLEKILEASRTFAKEVDPGTAKTPGEGPVLFSVTVVPLRFAHGWPSGRQAPSVASAISELNSLAVERIKAEALVNGLGEIRLHPTFYEKGDKAQLQKIDASVHAAISQIDSRASFLLSNPLGEPHDTSAYLAGVPALPSFSFPATLPVTVATRSGWNAGGDHAVTEVANGSLAGKPGVWIEAVGISLPVAPTGMHVEYVATFLHVQDHSTMNSVVLSGKDGLLIGKPPGGEYYALKSIRAKLSGAGSEEYSLFYQARYSNNAHTGFSTPEGVDGSLIAAEGPEFSTIPYYQGNYVPTSYLSQLTFRIAKK